jgi:hypothetical protein
VLSYIPPSYRLVKRQDHHSTRNTNTATISNEKMHEK